MNFIAVCNEFQKSLDGTDSYVELRDKMQSLMQSDSKSNAIYFIIHGFAHNYVQLYADQAVSTEFASKAKRVMQGYLDIAQAAFSGQYDPEVCWKVVNEIVNAYICSEQIF